jgi:ABC-2 type transport system ATP-binding protein
MIEVNGITKYYGTLKALDDVHFHVDKGEVLGFLGPNGAGKSTAMKILTTYISATEGTASVGGHDVHVFPYEVRRKIGYLPETPPLYGEMTVEAFLRFAGRARGLSGRNLKQRIELVTDWCGLQPKFKARIVELSKGFRQRTGIAQALIHDPEVLILDEPTSGLDPMQIIEIRNLIDRLREDKCIIFSTHILQEATAVANRLVIINGGKKIADGTEDQLAAQAADISRVRVLIKDGDDALVSRIEDLPGVRALDKEHPPLGYSRINLEVSGGISGMRAACERISGLVQESGKVLAELAPERLTLEGVFLNLLRKTNNGEAKPEGEKPAEERAEEAPKAETTPETESPAQTDDLDPGRTEFVPKPPDLPEDASEPDVVAGEIDAEKASRNKEDA